METTHAKQTGKKKIAKKLDDVESTAMETVENAEVALEERFQQAKDMFADLRESAERAIEEKPYLLPVATGALGLGVGVLIGSRLARFVLVTGAGALLSSTLRSEIGKLSSTVLHQLTDKIDEANGVEEGTKAEPSVV